MGRGVALLVLAAMAAPGDRRRGLGAGARVTALGRGASVLVLAAMAAPAAAQTDCSAAATQLAATDCAGAGADAADAELNRIWGQVWGSAKGRPWAQTLRDAQRAWIGYRDLACAAESGQYQGGSIAPMINASCLERLTRARIVDLQQFLEN
ncbi:lysozyme inhibitor LprI family protein [Amaricoccus sp.]|uniref:lysozyme inhibitor LprI family protein n=1 Tax=Amaricoccus sp. TaxID=1872485 RepID=UPI001B6FB9E7|nr:lysozyme inhibitor LprI family protein [Amaricoccus sp.]MBP7001268.1 DUF1311 domain-containing protein [Amaricoccus sp.]